MYGNIVTCSDSTSVNFEQVQTYSISLSPKFPITGNYYLFSGGVTSLTTSDSSYAHQGQASFSVDYFYELGGVRYYSNFDNFVFQGSHNVDLTFGFIIRGTVSPSFVGSSWTNNWVIPVLDVGYDFTIFSLSDSEVAGYIGNGGVVNGIKEGNDLQKKNNELQKEQNETSKGILGKITDFFASFFENLKGLFVPEDGYFSDFFTRLNDFFSEKLGMLYAPIDMFITFLNTIKDASSTDSGITFPELAWDGTVIIPETKFSFDTVYKDFPGLKEKIYFVTDVILVGAVLWLLQVKLKEVLEN